jgi:hypothetical protein
MKHNILITIVQSIAVWIFVAVFYILFSLWLSFSWLRDHGFKFMRPLFVWLAGLPLKNN